MICCQIASQECGNDFVGSKIIHIIILFSVDLRRGLVYWRGFRNLSLIFALHYKSILSQSKSDYYVWCFANNIKNNSLYLTSIKCQRRFDFFVSIVSLGLHVIRILLSLSYQISSYEIELYFYVKSFCRGSIVVNLYPIHDERIC